MKKESARDILKRDILELEARRYVEFKDLKEHFHTTYESLRPINFIKSTIKDVTESPDIKGGLGKAAIGLASGYLIKNILFRPTYNPLKKLAGIAIQAFATNLAAKNSDKIKETGMSIFHHIKSLLVPKKRNFMKKTQNLCLRQNL